MEALARILYPLSARIAVLGARSAPKRYCQTSQGSSGMSRAEPLAGCTTPRFSVSVLLVALAAAAATQSGIVAQAPERFDLLIRNAHVIDGTGNPWIRADVGIIGDRIQAVGTLGAAA